MIKKFLVNARKEGRRFLLEPECYSILEKYNIPVDNFRVARTAEEAAECANEIGYAVVLKILSQDVIHKSDLGGVALDLKTQEDVYKAFHKITMNVKKQSPNSKIQGVLVQEMVSPSIEVIVGAINDPQFGPTIMFGLGGVFVEVIKDVAFRLVPVRRDEALEMIREIKAYPILQGYRGTPAVDIESIAQILVNISRLVNNYPEIQELDLNPVVVNEKRAKVIDARLIID